MAKRKLTLPVKPTLENLGTYDIQPGHFIKGPEFYGCFGTGTAPILKRCVYNAAGIAYVVGPELDTRDFARALMFDATARKYAGKKVITGFGTCNAHHPIFAFGKKSAAVKKFRALCEQQMADNQQEARAHAGAVRRARSMPATGKRPSFPTHCPPTPAGFFFWALRARSVGTPAIQLGITSLSCPSANEPRF